MGSTESIYIFTVTKTYEKVKYKKKKKTKQLYFCFLPIYKHYFEDRVSQTKFKIESFFHLTDIRKCLNKFL